MTENSIRDPWLLEQEREKEIRRKTIEYMLIDMYMPPNYSEEPILLGNEPPYWRYPDGWVKITWTEESQKGGHNFGVPLPPASRLPVELINKDLIQFSNCPDDDLSIHILRLIGLHLKSMTDEQKKEIVKTINKQLNITMLWRKKIMMASKPFKMDVVINPVYNQIEVPIKLLSSEAKLPTKAHDTDAGYDLYSVEDLAVAAGDIIKTDIQIAVNIPPGYVGLIQDRSGMGSRGFKVFGGVIDAGYTGSIGVCLGNLKTGGIIKFILDTLICIIDKFTGRIPEIVTDVVLIPRGSKIAQLVILPLPTAKLVEVTEFESTERGEKGFGSSGQ